MFKRLLLLSLGVLLFSVAGFAQFFDFKTHQFVAQDFNQWTSIGTTTVAAGAATINIDPTTVRLLTVPGGGSFNPFFVNNILLIDDGTVQETVTITAASCTGAQTATACTITATFANAHTARYNVRSGSFGAQEAVIAASKAIGGGTVVIQPGWGGTTSIITSLVSGASTIGIVDMRSGVSNEFYWTGSAYVASSKPFDTTAPSQQLLTGFGSALTIQAASFLFTPVSGSGITTADNTNIMTIPAGAITIALTARVVTQLGNADGLTSWAVKDRTNPVISIKTGLALTAGTTIAGKDNISTFVNKFYASANNIDIIATGGTGFDATGSVRFTLYYILASAPTAYNWMEQWFAHKLQNINLAWVFENPAIVRKWYTLSDGLSPDPALAG